MRLRLDPLDLDRPQALALGVDALPCLPGTAFSLWPQPDCSALIHHNSDKGFMPSPKKLSVSVASTVRVPVEMVAVTRTPGRSG